MNPVALNSLLLSRDPEALRLFRRALGDVGIEVEVCTGSEAAQELLARQKFDTVIIDCDDLHGGTEVLKSLRKGISNKRVVALAILNGLTNMRSAFEMGAHFVLDKPLNLERIARSLRAAQGFMLAE